MDQLPIRTQTYRAETELESDDYDKEQPINGFMLFSKTQYTRAAGLINTWLDPN